MWYTVQDIPFVTINTQINLIAFLLEMDHPYIWMCNGYFLIYCNNMVYNVKSLGLDILYLLYNIFSKSASNVLNIVQILFD